MKLKEWLNTADEEGLTGKDAIVMFLTNLSAWVILILLALFGK